MGIKDLLRFMKPYIEPIHIKKYAGKRVGIDAYSWLHKGAYSCSMELCLDTNSEKKMRYVDYFMHRINLLRHYKITPVVVFDGGSIPCKAATESERHRRRKVNHELAMVRLKEGNVTAASELFQRAVSITPAMAHQLIQTLKSENIEFVVAPYEADAQLAYLASLEAEKGGIVAVITEDSDLLAYGCQAIVFKMDRYGNGEEISLENVFNAVAGKPSFQNFDKELFAGMCVLAGCDFLPSVPGIGIVKAHNLVSKYRNLDRVLSVLKYEKGNHMPEDYSKSFIEAVAVFQHAQIYDVDAKKLKHLKPLPPKLLQSLDGELDFLGPELPPSIATAIAQGNMDPTNMEAFNSSPSSGCHPTPVVIQTSSRFQKLETSMFCSQGRSFPVFSSHKTRQRNITGPPTEDLVSTKRKHFKEDAWLDKLISAEEIHITTENLESPNDIQLKVPENNPFKKRKLDEIPMQDARSSIEHASAVTEDIKSDLICATPQDTTSKFPVDNFFENTEESKIHASQTDSIFNQVSVVTQTESSDILCANIESQESVNSKPRKVSKGKGRGKSENSSSCKGSELKKNTILNFFSRV